MEVVQEKVMRNKTVLIITEISDNSLTSSVLIEVYCGIQRISVAILVFFNSTFVNFVLVKDRVLGLEQIIKVITKQIGHTSRVET